MKVGDLVMLPKTDYWRTRYGIGWIIEMSTCEGYCWVFFPDIVTPGFDGFKWMPVYELEVYSAL